MVSTFGFSFLGIFTACKQWNQGNKTVVEVSGCAIAALGLLIAMGSEAEKIGLLFYEVAQRTTAWALDVAMNHLMNKFNVAGFAGPFMRVARGVGVKRDDSHLYKRVVEHLSSKLGGEVRHIGFWDGSGLAETQLENVRREQSPEGIIPAFGITIDGHEAHFTYTGDTVKLGHGPGPATELNKRHLKARGELDGDVIYNDYYFDQGGFDMILASNPDSTIDEKVSSVDRFGHADAYKQVECLLGLGKGQTGESGNLSPQMNSIGLWFQVFDSNYQRTVAAGAIAPFSADTQSIM